MTTNLNPKQKEKFMNIIKTDYSNLSKKTDKFRLNIDIKKVNTYDDLKKFYNDYNDYLCFLSKTQIELILKENEWSKTVYTVLAANRFKDLIKK